MKWKKVGKGEEDFLKIAAHFIEDDPIVIIIVFFNFNESNEKQANFLSQTDKRYTFDESLANRGKLLINLWFD